VDFNYGKGADKIYRSAVTVVRLAVYRSFRARVLPIVQKTEC
jgi:hypothetical protein